MSQIADDMVDGLCCERCQTYFVKPHGYPVLCKHCKRNDPRSPTPRATHPELSESAHAH